MGLKAYKCPNCGGMIDLSTMRCPHCETQYREEFDGSNLTQDEYDILKYWLGGGN